MGKYIVLFLCILGDITVLASNSLVQDILQQEDGRPCVVLGCEDVLFQDDHMASANRKVIRERYPEALVVPAQCRGEKGQADQALKNVIFYPGVIELVLICLKRGWNVAFFSRETKDNIEPLLRSYVTFMLQQYDVDSDAGYDKLLARGRVRIFSAAQRVLVDNKNVFAQYTVGSGPKKNLETIGLNLASSILVEHGREQVVGGAQYPFIDTALVKEQKAYYRSHNKGVTINPYWAFKNLDKLHGTPGSNENIHHRDTRYPQADLVAYITGVLAKSSDLMKDGMQLRQAVAQTMTIQTLNSDRGHVLETPWHMEGSTPELPVKTYSMLVERGQKDIRAIQALKRVKAFTIDDPYLFLGKQIFGEAFIPEDNVEEDLADFNCAVM